MLGKDIRFIKLGDSSLRPKGDFFFGTVGYYLCYLIPLLLFVVFAVIYRQKALENANVAKVKTKKANKVATRWLVSCWQKTRRMSSMTKC